MVRFDQEGLFDRMAVRGVLTPALLSELAVAVARLHAPRPRRTIGMVYRKTSPLAGELTRLAEVLGRKPARQDEGKIGTASPA